MTKRLFLAVTFLLILGIVSFNISAAAPAASFSADYKMTDAKGNVTTGKMFMSGNKIRQETTINGETTITILRLDLKVSWTLMAENQYMEVKLPFDPAHPSEDSDIQYEKATIGTETVNGYTCQVVQITYKEKKYGIVTQWVANKLSFPIKVQTKDSKNKVTMTTEYTNIKVGKQPNSLFEVPKGYEKIGLNFKIPGM